MYELHASPTGDPIAAPSPPATGGPGRGGPRAGVDWLRHPDLNKGTAFTEAERDALGLRGLLPPRVFSQEEQVKRALLSLRRKSSELEQYVHLMDLQDRNETLFYRVVMEHLEEMLPIIYTPTVGKACQEYGTIFRRPRGLYLTAYDAIVEEFVTGVAERWPRALIQFEDFASHNAFRLLEKYQSRVCTFNDDIQGTAAVALAGVLSALRLTEGELKNQIILLFGAGEAGIGIGELVQGVSPAYSRMIPAPSS